MKITVNRALMELKLLNKRIEDGIASMQVCAMNDGTVDKCAATALAARFESQIKSVTDLIGRYHRIKAAVMRSNSVTMVSINGMEMTVAEAIARKENLKLEKDFAQKLRQTFVATERQITNHNANVQAEANKQARLMAEAKDGGFDQVAYEAIYNSFITKNKREMIAPTDLENKIKEISEKVESFAAEVDLVLNESNARTEIEIDD